MYYYRRRVPLDLVEFFGKVEFNESLRTKDRRTAEAACRRLAVTHDAIFSKARGQMLEAAVTPGPAPAKPMTPEQKAQQERAQADWEEWNTEQDAIESMFEDELREERANKQASYRSLMAFAQSLELDMPVDAQESLQAIFARQAGKHPSVTPRPPSGPLRLLAPHSMTSSTSGPGSASPPRRQ